MCLPLHHKGGKLKRELNSYSKFCKFLHYHYVTLTILWLIGFEPISRSIDLQSTAITTLPQPINGILNTRIELVTFDLEDRCSTYWANWGLILMRFELITLDPQYSVLPINYRNFIFGGTWTLTLKHSILSRARLPFRHKDRLVEERIELLTIYSQNIILPLNYFLLEMLDSN